MVLFSIRFAGVLRLSNGGCFRSILRFRFVGRIDVRCLGNYSFMGDHARTAQSKHNTNEKLPHNSNLCPEHAYMCVHLYSPRNHRSLVNHHPQGYMTKTLVRERGGDGKEGQRGKSLIELGITEGRVHTQVRGARSVSDTHKECRSTQRCS